MIITGSAVTCVPAWLGYSIYRLEIVPNYYPLALTVEIRRLHSQPGCW